MRPKPLKILTVMAGKLKDLRRNSGEVAFFTKRFWRNRATCSCVAGTAGISLYDLTKPTLERLSRIALTLETPAANATVSER